MFKKLSLANFIVGLLLGTFLLTFGFAFAQTETPTPTPSTSSRLQEIQRQITEAEAKIAGLKSQEKTLSSQIAVVDNQIALTTLRINAVKQQISDLTLDIDTTTKKITSLETSIDELTKVLINRIKATYITGSASSFQILIASSNVSDFVERANYLRIAQAHDKRLIYDTVQAKNDYSNQKTIFEDKKEQVEALKAELEGYTAQLEQEKKDKNALLQVTRNDEAVYQQRLQTALAEQRAIQGIIAGLGTEVSVKKVNEGDAIARVLYGKTPCSTWTHLHFEVRRDGGLQDPSGYLSNKGVSWDNGPDSPFGFSGPWNWPLNDPIYITQGYGMTFYARQGNYNGGPHTGIDMVSNDTSVKAVKPGQLYSGSIGGCYGGPLLYSKVVHDDGIQTYYLHAVTLQ